MQPNPTRVYPISKRNLLGGELTDAYGRRIEYQETTFIQKSMTD